MALRTGYKRFHRWESANVQHAPKQHRYPCIVCGGQQLNTVLDGITDKLWWKPGRFSIAVCADCGLAQSSPRPDADGLAEYYAGVYDSDEARDGLRVFYEGRVGRLLNYYRQVTIEKVRPVTDADHVLDVGCSYGFFLHAIQTHSGCLATGIDLDAGSIQHAVGRDKIDYRRGTLQTANIEDGSVSIVTFFQCLEHDPTPVETLQAARKALRPGGLVVIEVPNWDGWLRSVCGRFWHPLFQPQHIGHFSPTTLADAVQRAGLRPVHHQTMLFPSELTLSLRAALLHVILGEGKKPSAGFERVLAPLWVLVFWLFDVPLQIFLRAISRAGHQTLIAERPLEH